MPMCPHCVAAMQEGLFVDGSQGTYVQSIWMEGHPVEQRLLGMHMGNLNLSGRTRYPVTVYRCPQCGFLQAFALPRNKENEEAAQTLLRAAQPDVAEEGEQRLRAGDREQTTV